MLLVFVGSRMYFLVAGALLVGIMPLEPFHLRTSDVPFGTLSIWAHYDGDHYVSAELNGYTGTADASPAFFPLYPFRYARSPSCWGVQPHVGRFLLSPPGCP